MHITNVSPTEAHVPALLDLPALAHLHSVELVQGKNLTFTQDVWLVERCAAAGVVLNLHPRDCVCGGQIPLSTLANRSDLFRGTGCSTPGGLAVIVQ